MTLQYINLHVPYL